MSIRFICTCGKRLRARDEMASRRSVCPRCGAPVGIPSRQAPVRGAPAGPLSPAEKFHTRRVVPRTESIFSELVSAEPEALSPSPAANVIATVPVPAALAPDAVQPAAPPKRKRGYFRRGQMETHWYHCLLYPLRALPLVLGLAVILTLVTGVLVLLIPELLELRMHPWWHAALCSTYLLVPLAMVGYACASLDCVLDAGLAGRAAYLAWPGRNLGLALTSSVRWLVCFLAGPVFLAGVIVAFWIYCGDLLQFDWFIIAELGVITVGYWLFVLASVGVSGSLAGVNPLYVIDLIHRLGYRSAVVAALASAVAGGHAWLGIIALDGIHRGASGWAWLFATWSSSLFWAVFVFRLLGVWCHRACLSTS
jgi:hypothetical protein